MMDNFDNIVAYNNLDNYYINYYTYYMLNDIDIVDFYPINLLIYVF